LELRRGRGRKGIGIESPGAFAGFEGVKLSNADLEVIRRKKSKKRKREEGEIFDDLIALHGKFLDLRPAEEEKKLRKRNSPKI